MVKQAALRGVHELRDVRQTQTGRAPLGVRLGLARTGQVAEGKQADAVVVLDHRAVVGLECRAMRGGSLELGDRPDVLLLQPRQRERLVAPRTQVVQSQLGCDHPCIPAVWIASSNRPCSTYTLASDDSTPALAGDIDSGASRSTARVR